MDNPPTCIIYPDDFSAFGGINAIRGMGLRIPEDVSIAGYDGIPLARQAEPKLTTVAETTVAETTAADTVADEGKVLNIYCWNTEFQSRVKSHYPGYEEVDGTTGKIGDVTVNWNVTPSDDNAYQNNLDTTLLGQESASTDDPATVQESFSDWNKFAESATTGPQGFYWGGTWICVAEGTDNPSLVKDIILTLTTDDATMQDIVTQDNDFVNNKPVMDAMAKDESCGDAVLGGQNAIPMFCEGVEKIDLSNTTIYDQGCTEEFQNAMKNYFEGNATYEEALDLFYKGVTEKYPELTY